MEREIVVCFLRCGTELCLVRPSGGDADGADPGSGRWSGVSAALDGEPDETARRAIERFVSAPTSVSLLERGASIGASDTGAKPRRIYPYLFECPSREVVAADAECEWRQPPAMFDLETVPGLWEAYLAVAPSVRTVREDADHGAAYISLRALEVLRDRAARVADEDGDYREIEATARALLRARPSMGVVENRVNRVMATGEGAAESVLGRAMEACEDAVEADGAAAESAVSVMGDRVFTLSRSGTVLEALEAASPAAVFVADSRPGREGIAVAETLASAGIDVTVLADAAVGGVVASEVDTVLVGADSVLEDGQVVNKVGTHNAASAAAGDVECFAVCSRDKIVPGTELHPEHGPAAEIYAGDADLSVHNPTFERVPAALFSGVVTESGVLSESDIEDVAAEHAALARWDE